jgi:hypothetical protein
MGGCGGDIRWNKAVFRIGAALASGVQNDPSLREVPRKRIALRIMGIRFGIERLGLGRSESMKSVTNEPKYVQILR